MSHRAFLLAYKIFIMTLAAIDPSTPSSPSSLSLGGIRADLGGIVFPVLDARGPRPRWDTHPHTMGQQRPSPMTSRPASYVVVVIFGYEGCVCVFEVFDANQTLVRIHAVT